MSFLYLCDPRGHTSTGMTSAEIDRKVVISAQCAVAAKLQTYSLTAHCGGNTRPQVAVAANLYGRYAAI